MTAERVETAIELIARKNMELGMWAQGAADGLTAGEGEELISQASLQRWLWYYLPKKTDEESWEPLVLGAVALLDELGLGRYADIARSDTTASVLRAWRSGGDKGFARYKTVSDASGVEPIDTDLLAWGDVMGVYELEASDHVERALERAIVEGRFKPGSKAWRPLAAVVCEEALRQDANVPTQTWLTMVITERVESWVNAGRPDQLRELRQAIANRLLSPPDPPANISPVTAPMRWLLESCRDGVELTQAGYLPTGLVKEALRLFFPFDGRYGKPRSEVDVLGLMVLRATASRLGALGRRRRQLKTTREGIRLLDDPAAMWRAITVNLDEGDAFSKTVSELLAHRLLQGPAVGEELGLSVAPILCAQGWHAEGVPITEEGARYSVYGPLWGWRLFALLHEQEPRWENGQQVLERVTDLTDAGHLAALSLLHARATAPRRTLGSY